MSPYGRWRSFRIVGPLTKNREDEIVGGLKNAIERGEPIEKAKQSFTSAGYSPAEVNAAAQKVPASTSQIPTQAQPATTPAQPTTSQAKPLPLAQGSIQPKKKFSKKLIIILSIAGALILVVAAILGIFWDSFFG